MTITGTKVPFAPTRVVCDTRERKGLLAAVHAAGIAHPDDAALPYGDYWLHKRNGGLVVVEHKYHDLAQDWPTRLPTQLKKCREGADEVVLLVEDVLPTDYTTGRLEAGHHLRGVYYDQVWSYLLRQQREWGLRVYQCPGGNANVVRALRAILKHYRRVE